jgi:hypothetical protein
MNQACPPGREAEDPWEQGLPGADQKSTPKSTKTIVAQRSPVRAAAAKLVETAASAAELVVWFAAVRAALWLVWGASNG